MITLLRIDIKLVSPARDNLNWINDYQFVTYALHFHFTIFLFSEYVSVRSWSQDTAYAQYRAILQTRFRCPGDTLHVTKGKHDVLGLTTFSTDSAAENGRDRERR